MTTFRTMSPSTGRAVATALRHAAIAATQAPSVHNTQPWRLVIAGPTLRVHADMSRRLTVLDTRGRQMMLSLGAAVFNARVALAAAGFVSDVELMPDLRRTTLAARVTARPSVLLGPEHRALARLAPAIDVRRTNRRPFTDDAVPPALVETCLVAAMLEGARLMNVTRPEHRAAVARLAQWADAIENADPRYRAELRAWCSADPYRLDGVPAFAVRHIDDEPREDEIPLRDFDTLGVGLLPSETHQPRHQCLLLLGTDGDDELSWLLAGQALERIWLEITAAGFTSSPLTQVIEVARCHEQLREELHLSWHPDVVLRVGRAPVTPATRRRLLSDVLNEIN